MFSKIHIFLLAFFHSAVLMAAEAVQPSGQLYFDNQNTTIRLESISAQQGIVIYRDTQGHQFGIADELIVRVDNSLSSREVQGLDAHITRIQMLAPLANENIYLLHLDIFELQPVMDHLAQHKGVHYVQPNMMQKRKHAAIYDARELSSMISDVQFHKLIKQPKVGARVAIIDDGFNVSHPEFKDLNLLFSYDADQKTLQSSVKSNVDRHGTLVAGLIFARRDGIGVEGLAPNAPAILIRQTSTWTSDIVLAFVVAKMMRADIVNCSWTLEFLPQPVSDVVLDLLDQSANIIVAAGNDGVDACEGNALSIIAGVTTVGALADNGQRATFTNYGDCVDIYAPSSFMTTAPDGSSYHNFTGTSASAAFISGVLARYRLRQDKLSN